jgi:hypothetical protein
MVTGSLCGAIVTFFASLASHAIFGQRKDGKYQP